MQRTILVFGLVAGLIVSLMMIITMLIHKQNPASFEWGMPVGYASMLLAFSLIPVAVKSYRDRYRAGVISFKDAFLMGLGITVIASVMYLITWVILSKTFYPTFAQDYTQFSLNQMKADGKSPTEIEQARQEMQRLFAFYNTWWGLIAITFLEIFPVGLLATLLSALILKSKGPRAVSTPPTREAV